MKRIISPWSQAEIERLRSLIAKRASPIRSAAALKRNVASVRRQARLLGLSFPTLQERRRSATGAPSICEDVDRL